MWRCGLSHAAVPGPSGCVMLWGANRYHQAGYVRVSCLCLCLGLAAHSACLVVILPALLAGRLLGCERLSARHPGASMIGLSGHPPVGSA